MALHPYFYSFLYKEYLSGNPTAQIVFKMESYSYLISVLILDKFLVVNLPWSCRSHGSSPDCIGSSCGMRSTIWLPLEMCMAIDHTNHAFASHKKPVDYDIHYCGPHHSFLWIAPAINHHMPCEGGKDLLAWATCPCTLAGHTWPTGRT